jgi:Na+-driven multidrug efflux pump
LGLRYSFMLCGIASILFLAMPERILGIFTSDPDIIRSASPLLPIIAVTIFPVAVNVVIGGGIRGMKDTRWMFYTQMIGTAFTVVLCAVLVLRFHMGLTGVFLTALADESIRAVLNLIRFVRGRAGLPKLFHEPRSVGPGTFLRFKSTSRDTANR